MAEQTNIIELHPLNYESALTLYWRHFQRCDECENDSLCVIGVWLAMTALNAAGSPQTSMTSAFAAIRRVPQ